MKSFGQYLMEQAMNLSDAESRITSMSYEIEAHLLKLLMCGTTDPNYNHWLSEIDAWLKIYNKIVLKSNNKQPTSHQVNKWARTEWLTENVYKNDVNSIKEDYPEARNITYSEFNKIYEKVLNLSVSDSYSKTNLSQILRAI